MEMHGTSERQTIGGTPCYYVSQMRPYLYSAIIPETLLWIGHTKAFGDFFEFF